MKLQQIILTGLLALATTMTAQSAAFSAEFPTQLTSDDVAAIGIATPRNTNISAPTMMVAQFKNPTHPTANEISAVQINRTSRAGQAMSAMPFDFNLTHLTSDDVAAIGIATPRNPELNAPKPMTTMRAFINPTHPTALEIGKVSQ
jgi:hypothetical protein